MKPKVGEFDEQWILDEAQRQYTEGEASFGIDPGHTALVVVDMIDEFVKPNWSPYWCPEATRQVPKIRKVIDAFHEADLPVIYLAYEISVHGLNFPAPLLDTPMGEGIKYMSDEILQSVSIYKDIAPEPQDIVILKHTYSGFRGTELDLVLRGKGISTVVICGTMTNYCCGATAREALWHNYRVVFGSDINSNDDPELHDAEIKTLRRGYARIMTADEIVAALTMSEQSVTAS
jgi:nicotinamidase-related amidase